jgi:signal-transduction protein with cAMP-binding, CBS, and nucleotidyltransferase domain
MDVWTIVKAKAEKVPAITQSDSVLNAVKKMLAINESGLLILTPAGNLVGIITEKDVMRLVAERYTQLDKVEVWEVMSKELTTINPSTQIDDALAIMTDKRIHHLPIKDGEQVMGLIALDDIIAAQLKKTKKEAQLLKDFIAQQ